MATVLTVILGIIAIALTIVVLMQADRSAGLGAISGASSSSDSYWSKNKGNSMEGALEKYTKILGALFMIIALVLNFIG